MIITADLETSGLNWREDQIHLIGYRIDRKGEVSYDTEALKGYLSDPNVVLSGHHIRFDALFLANNGYNVQCQLEDTRVLAYLNWPEAPDHSLKTLVRERLRLKPTELSDIQFKPLKKDIPYLNEDEYFTFTDGKYCRKDLLIPYHKDDIINVDRLRAILRTPEWFTEVEMPLTRILFEMELYGCPLDQYFITVLRQDFTRSHTALLETLERHRTGPKGEAYNPNSSAHNAHILAQIGHNLEELCEKTDKGAYRVDKSLLKALSWKGDEFSKSLLEYKKYDKILSTYILPFEEGSRKDGRLHGSINQAGSEDAYGDGKQGTHTGRLSSSNPNLQNIPSRTKEGKEVRRLFVSSNKESYMFDSDLSQIEPRLVAHYTQAPKLINAYREGLDTHSLFARDIFNTVEPSPTQRFIGKSSWLATVYGCSNRKLLTICENFSSEPLTLELDDYYRRYDALKEDCGDYCLYGCKKHLQKNVGKEARLIYAQWEFFKNVQEQFKAKNKEIFDWRENHIARTRRIGYVVTLGGRRIDVSGLSSKSFKERAQAERRAVNYLIQGSAADIMKLIIVRFKKEFIDKGLGRVFASVHDELLGEVFDKKHIEVVRDIMENTVKLRNVQIKSDTKLVMSWGDK